MSDTILELQGIKKSFGDTHVLKGIDLTVKRGEFITLLGSSGCGKTTLLRIISGLETADEGKVLLEGQDVTFTEPNRRNVNTVFQSYALFPHMNVFDNVGYSLKLKKTPKREIEKRVNEALELVRLPGYGKRMPSELSGGQRQRVAIARSVISQPKVLLLDEPLGALDLNLRHEMQIELKKLQKQLGITFIYITHDQEEAINMSDRIAIINGGRFEQLASPTDIYERPKTSYVASFVGSANIIKGTAKREDNGLFIESEGTVLPVNGSVADIPDGSPLTVAVRRENILLSDRGDGIRAVVTDKSFAAGMTRTVVRTEGGEEITATSHGITSPAVIGDCVFVRWDGENAVPVDTEAADEK